MVKDEDNDFMQVVSQLKITVSLTIFAIAVVRVAVATNEES